MDPYVRFSLQEVNDLLPLVQSIGREIVERRTVRRNLVRTRQRLEGANTPEGLIQAISDLDARIFEQDEAIDWAARELENLGLTVLRTYPLTVHFPGQTRMGPVVFCWEEDEERVCHGHPVGAEEDPRRPLKLRAHDA